MKDLTKLKIENALDSINDNLSVIRAAIENDARPPRCISCHIDLNDDDRRWCGERTSFCRECRGESKGL